MRLLLLVLVIANLVFFGLQRGYLGPVFSDAREPARLNAQIKPERLRLSSEAAPAAASSAISTAPAAVNIANDAAGVPQSCVEYGGFGEDDSKLVLVELTSRLGTARISSRSADEITSYMIYLPPFKTREEAVQATQLLKDNGITDYFIIDDSSPLRLGISLGISRNEEMAKAQVATLNRKGIKEALIRPRTSKRTWLQVRDNTPDLRASLIARLADLKAKYPAQELKDCASL